MSKTLVIACGALAHELTAVLNLNQWTHIEVQCLPAHWHNTPNKIPSGVERKIIENQHLFDRILVAYGDCGTGGQLDAVLDRHNIERLPGDHCYAFFTGQALFDNMVDEELGTFYLTDYLAWHFDRLILDELGIRKHPELRDMYFAHYTRVLYLVQTVNPQRLAQAQAAADALLLPLDIHSTGLKPFEQSLKMIHITPQ